MHKTLIIEAAASNADTLNWLQLASAVIVGVAAIAVPAYFAARDRRTKRTEARRRARSFALAHFHELELLRDYLSANVAKNPTGQPVKDHSAIAEALRGASDCKIPLIDLHLLDESAEPVQLAFAAIARAQSYQLRRASFAQKWGGDVEAQDMAQAQWLRDAHEALRKGIEQMELLLR
ncbi:hypothetical protein I5U77_02995 [Stenotrophomonas maltophilia]|uniref:hypothetical protein n=1 Tax=Stenotrophomonas maltophilia TaxID=40324 RepID=UPI0013DAB353|nr:hypothetical protein [Stenotrophomonas maltophilia]MBH1591418.1 hypothetical protein [Stenotrophomonas maltophilia]